MTEIRPRWEWRSFGERFGPAEAHIASLSPTGVQESDELYLLSDAGANVKVRDALMDIKVLREVDADGLEQWTPVMKGILLLLILTRSDVETTVLRTPGTLFQKRDDGRISNIYAYKVVNKTSREMPIRFELIGSKGEVKLVGTARELGKAELIEGELFIILDKADVHGYTTELNVGIFSGDKLIDQVRTSFVGPITKAS